MIVACKRWQANVKIKSNKSWLQNLARLRRWATCFTLASTRCLKEAFKPSAENVCEERQYLSLSESSTYCVLYTNFISLLFCWPTCVRTTDTTTPPGLNNTSLNWWFSYAQSLLFISLSLGLLYLLLHGLHRLSCWTLSGPLSVKVSGTISLCTRTSIAWHHLGSVPVHFLNVNCDFGSFRFNKLKLVLLLAIQP